MAAVSCKKCITSQEEDFATQEFYIIKADSSKIHGSWWEQIKGLEADGCSFSSR